MKCKSNKKEQKLSEVTDRGIMSTEGEAKKRTNQDFESILAHLTIP
jgi:hypothetical protein